MNPLTERSQQLVDELFLNQDLNRTLSSFVDRFQQKESIGIRVWDPICTAERMAWQKVTCGYPGRKSYDEKFRGYLMIEPADFPVALELLDQIAMRRLKEGKYTDFKWLMMTYPSTGNVRRYVTDPSNIGSYSGLQSTDSRIVLYANEKEEIAEIMSEVVANSQWERVEAHRRTIFESYRLPTPIRGTTAFVDRNGREWRSLNFNASPGTSESQTRSETA